MSSKRNASAQAGEGWIVWTLRKALERPLRGAKKAEGEKMRESERLYGADKRKAVARKIGKDALAGGLGGAASLGMAALFGSGAMAAPFALIAIAVAVGKGRDWAMRRGMLEARASVAANWATDALHVASMGSSAGMGAGFAPYPTLLGGAGAMAIASALHHRLGSGRDEARRWALERHASRAQEEMRRADESAPRMGPRERRLLSALIAGDERGAMRELNAGANPRAIDRDTGKTMLHALAAEPSRGGFAERMIGELVRRGADADARSLDSGETPMGMAARSANQAAIKALAEAGADPSIRDKAGFFPLLHAASLKAPGCIGEMLRAGADPEQESARYGVGPLAHALRLDNEGCARELIEGGANVKRALRGLPKEEIERGRRGENRELSWALSMESSKRENRKLSRLGMGAFDRALDIALDRLGNGALRRERESAAKSVGAKRRSL